MRKKTKLEKTREELADGQKRTVSKVKRMSVEIRGGRENNQQRQSP